MAITINIYYKSNNGNALKFANEMRNNGIVDKIRSNPGNLKYDYFISLDDQDTLLLIDSWNSQDDIDAHHNSDIMQEIINLRNKYDLKMTVERYYPEEKELSEFDKSFIRN